MAKKKSATQPVALSNYRKEFVSLLNQFSGYGYSRFNVFSDFLHLAAISIANSCAEYNLVNKPETILEREETYKRIIAKYKPELHDVFAKMLAAITMELTTYPPRHLTDVLGEIFHALDFQDEWKAQCFTPQGLSDLMGRIQFNDAAKVQSLIEAKGYVTVNDSACGGGALYLGAANGLQALGFNPQKQMLVVGNDLDERCVHMSFIQLSLYGIPAIILRQNTLTLEIFDEPWITPMFILDGWIFKARKFFKDEPQVEVEPVKPTPPPVIEPQVEDLPLGQLSLF